MPSDNDSPVWRVRHHLEPYGLVVVELADDTSTALLAARALGTTVDAIVKSLVFVADKAPILVLASGGRKVQTRRVAQVLGATKVRLARADEVVDITGYPVGGVPPVAHRQPLRTLVDRHLLTHDTVYAAAGAAHAVFAVTPGRLVEIASGRVADIAE